MSRGKTVPGFSLNSFVAPKEDWYKTLTFQDSIDMAKEKMVSTAENFVALGYYLKHIRDKELYKEKGYKDIWECASKELYLIQPTASRYINVCEKFSIDGDSPYLDVKYKDYGKSQLLEILSINDQNLIEQITPDMTVKQIQRLKKSNKAKKNDDQPKQPIENQPTDVYGTLPGQMQVVIDGTFRELRVDKEDEIESTDNTTESDTSVETNDIDVPEVKVPTDDDIIWLYNYRIKEYDDDRAMLKEQLIEKFGRSNAGGCCDGGMYDFSRKGVRINGSDYITYSELVKRINMLIPKEEKVTELSGKTVALKGGYDLNLINRLIEKYKRSAEEEDSEKDCILDALELLKEKLLTIDG